MNRELLGKAEAKFLKSTTAQFSVGDTVNVSLKIKEGDKERVQIFRGTVIGRRGGGVSQTFIVRRIVNNEGVERTFPLHSPSLVGVEVVRSGRTRRAKLFFLRDRVGKSVRLRDLIEGETASAPAKAKAKALAQAQPAAKE